MMTVKDKWEKVALLKAALEQFNHIPQQEFDAERVARVQHAIETWVTRQDGGTRENFQRLCRLLNVPASVIEAAVRS